MIETYWADTLRFALRLWWRVIFVAGGAAGSLRCAGSVTWEYVGSIDTSNGRWATQPISVDEPTAKPRQSLDLLAM